MRATLNTLAVLTILLGSWTLVSPQPLAADPDQSCCKVGNAECCGDKCEATGNGCTACSGPACLIKDD